MQNFNFLTKEYQMRLFFEYLAKVGIFIFVIVFSIELLTSLVIKSRIKYYDGQISITNSKIKDNQTKKIEFRKKADALPDLTSKIQIIEDIFSNTELRVSEVLYTVKENTPDGIWFDQIDYSDGLLTLKGTSYKNEILTLSSEKNIYLLEEKLQDTEKYSTIDLDYLKREDKFGHKINTFRYQLKVRK